MIKVTSELLNKVSAKAVESPRKRINHNFHPLMNDPLQRLLNAIEPDTYIQPHKHENPDKREVFFILSGTALVVEFDENGNISDNVILNNSKGNFIVEIAEKTYHSIISLEKGTVVYEIKDGPYSPNDDKNFAKWAPKEGDANTLEFNLKILKALNIK